MTFRNLLTAVPVVMNNSKPCHCHLLLTLKSKLLILLNHYIPRCPYYTVCFAFRRSGVHPPFTIFL